MAMMNEMEYRTIGSALAGGYRAAVYCRLSKDDDLQGESASIANQRDMLEKYCEKQGWEVVAVYQDDGFTGLNMERPDLQRMLRAIERRQINLVITKDLSRLGRNYLQTGHLIEDFFPRNGVRYIAMNDGIDTLRDNNDIAPFKNILNEMYVKDLSKKMKSAYRAMWQKGEYSSGSVPYGYVNEGRRLQPDDGAKEIVQEIFRLFLQGSSLKEIARILSAKTVNPKAYKTLRFGHEVPDGMNTEWNCVTVRAILTNHAYIGASVHNKNKRVNGKQVRTPKEEWIIVEDTHEPLVSREDFDMVQEMLADNVKQFRSTHGKNGFDHSRFNLVGKKIICADCGKIMGFRTEGTRHINKFYRCKTYLDTTKKGCTNHKVSLETVNRAVYDAIHEHMRLCVDTEDAVRRKNAGADSVRKYDVYGKEAGRIKRELQRTAEVKAGIFEDYKDGLIDEEQYTEISRKYAVKIKELSARLDEMLKAQAEYSMEYRVDGGWKAAVERFRNERELTREMAEAFVDKVLVYEDGSVRVHLKYDKELKDLLSLGTEREAV